MARVSSKKNLIVIITVLFISLLSCKKFEEGPNFSIRTCTNRLKGTWLITSYTIDGVDSLDSMGFETLTYIFEGAPDRHIQGVNCTTCRNQEMYWDYSNLKNGIVFWYTESTSPLEYTYSVNSQASASSWEIRRLTKSELILQSFPNLTAREYRMILKKQ